MAATKYHLSLTFLTRETENYLTLLVCFTLLFFKHCRILTHLAMSKPSIVNTKQLLHILFAIFFNWQHWKKTQNNQVNPVYSVVLCVQHSLLLLIMRTWQIQNATKPFHGFIKLIIQFLPAFKIPKVDDEVG